LKTHSGKVVYRSYPLKTTVGYTYCTKDAAQSFRVFIIPTRTNI